MREKQTLPQLPTTTPVLMESGLISRPWAMALQKLFYGPREAASSGLLADKPTDLKLNDEGYLYEATDFKRFFRWTGTAWERAPGELPTLAIVESPIAITAPGWKVMNGTGNPVTYTLDNGTTATISLPDASGAYLKQGAWTGSVIAATAPGVTGVADPAGAHNHGGSTTVSGVGVDIADTGGGTTVSSDAHTHGINPESDHTHVLTLLADTTGEPKRLVVYRAVKL